MTADGSAGLQRRLVLTSGNALASGRSPNRHRRASAVIRLSPLRRDELAAGHLPASRSVVGDDDHTRQGRSGHARVRCVIAVADAAAPVLDVLSRAAFRPR